MKKEISFIFVVIVLFSIFSLTLVKADLVNIDPENLENTNIAGINPGDVSSPEDMQNQSTQYLKQEWNKILEKYPVGRFILKIGDFFEFFNPLWKIVFGMEFSLSWAFVFTLILWITILIFVYEPCKAIFSNQIFGLIAAFIIASIVGVSGVYRKATDLLNTIITNKWIFWLSLALTIIVCFLIVKLGGGLKDIIKKEKEASEKDKTEKAQKIIQTSGKVAVKELEDFSDGAGI